MPKVSKKLPFLEARALVHTFKIGSQSKWYKFRKSDQMPDSLPSNPYAHYINKGWTNWGDFLGTGTPAPQYKQYRDFNAARKYARSLNLNGRRAWNKLAKLGGIPDDIPACPRGSATYKNEWTSWGDWLGTGNLPSQTEFISYEECKKLAISLNIKTQKEWFKLSKNKLLPIGVPSTPHQTYKDKGWITWGKFLETGNIWVVRKRDYYIPFNDAREYVRSLTLKNQLQWIELTKSSNMPSNIPKTPQQVFKKDWISWDNWLGTGKISLREKGYRYVIYEIYCKQLDTYYIGKTNNLRIRKSTYKKADCHNNVDFSNAIKTYGWDTFKVSILSDSGLLYDDAIKLEKQYIKSYMKSGKKLFNIHHKNNRP